MTSDKTTDAVLDALVGRLAALERRVAALEAAAPQPAARTPAARPAKARDVWGDQARKSPLEPKAAVPHAPKNGQALRALAEELGVTMSLALWAKERKYPFRISTWSRKQVAAGYAEARRLAGLDTPPEAPS